MLFETDKGFTMQPSDVFGKMLTMSIGPALKELGFSRKGSTFYLYRNENYGLINFQKSVSNTSESLRFTVNLGICSTKLYKFRTANSKSTKPLLDDCHWTERLGFLLPGHSDIWWIIDRETDLAQFGEKLTRYISELAVPEIEKYITDEALRDLWLAGKSPGLTETQRLINLSVLLQDLGPSNLLGPTLERLRTISYGKPTAQLVEMHMQKLQQSNQ